MATYQFYLVSLCLAWLLCASNAENVQFNPCDDNPGNCIVHEVRVVPCPESEEHKPCKVKRGKSASIEFDYTTQWNSTGAHGQVFSVTDDGDLPLAGMNTNACDSTACPIQPSAKQTYQYTLPLAKKFPVLSAKWVLIPSDGSSAIQPSQKPARSDAALQPKLSSPNKNVLSRNTDIDTSISIPPESALLS